VNHIGKVSIAEPPWGISEQRDSGGSSWNLGEWSHYGKWSVVHWWL